MKTLNKSAIDWTDRQEVHNEVMDLTCVPMRDKNRLCSLPFQGHDDREDCIQQPHLLQLGGRHIHGGLVYHREPDLYNSWNLPYIRIRR